MIIFLDPSPPCWEIFPNYTLWLIMKASLRSFECLEIGRSWPIPKVLFWPQFHFPGLLWSYQLLLTVALFSKKWFSPIVGQLLTKTSKFINFAEIHSKKKSRKLLLHTIQEPLERCFQNTPYFSQVDNYSTFGGCPKLENFEKFYWKKSTVLFV